MTAAASLNDKLRKSQQTHNNREVKYTGRVLVGKMTGNETILRSGSTRIFPKQQNLAC